MKNSRKKFKNRIKKNKKISIEEIVGLEEIVDGIAELSQDAKTAIVEEHRKKAEDMFEKKCVKDNSVKNVERSAFIKKLQMRDAEKRAHDADAKRKDAYMPEVYRQLDEMKKGKNDSFEK